MQSAANPFVSVLLALTLAVTAAAVVSPAAPPEPAASPAPPERIPALYAAVKAALDNNDFYYSYNEDVDTFYLEVRLEGTLSTGQVDIALYDDMITFVCRPQIRVREEYRDQMAALQSRINWNRSFAQLQMDYSDGTILSYGYLIAENVIPGPEEVGIRLYFTIDMLEEFGDAIAKVAMLGVKAEKALPKGFGDPDARSQ